MAENSRRPSGTCATPARTKSAGAACVIAWPSIMMSPARAGSSPEMQRISVVLPAPFDPMMQTSSPAPTASDTSQSTCTSP